MATIKLKDLNNPAKLKKFCEKITEEQYVDKEGMVKEWGRQSEEFANMFHKAHIDAYKNFVADWYNDSGFRRIRTNPTSMLKSTRYRKNVRIKIEKGKYLCRVTSTSYIDPHVYYNNFNHKSIDRWNDKYSANLNTAEYVLGLQWKEGIVGLPRWWKRPNPCVGVMSGLSSSANGYRNPYYARHKLYGLRQYLYGIQRLDEYEDKDGKYQTKYVVVPGRVQKAVANTMNINPKSIKTFNQKKELW